MNIEKIGGTPRNPYKNQEKHWKPKTSEEHREIRGTLRKSMDIDKYEESRNLTKIKKSK